MLQKGIKQHGSPTRLVLMQFATCISLIIFCFLWSSVSSLFVCNLKHSLQLTMLSLLFLHQLLLLS